MREKQMNGKSYIWILIVLMSMGVLFLGGCSKKKVLPGPGSGMGQSGEGSIGDSSMGQLGEQGLSGGYAGSGTGTGSGLDSATAQEAQEALVKEDVYFDYDSSALNPDAESTLLSKASYLQQNTSVHIIVEGHTDDRGTVEYNLSLGERRAESCKSFLINNGISADRIITISYGEERPAAGGSDESAWAKNRRAHFVLQ